MHETDCPGMPRAPGSRWQTHQRLRKVQRCTSKRVHFQVTRHEHPENFSNCLATQNAPWFRRPSSSLLRMCSTKDEAAARSVWRMPNVVNACCAVGGSARHSRLLQSNCSSARCNVQIDDCRMTYLRNVPSGQHVLHAFHVAVAFHYKPIPGELAVT